LRKACVVAKRLDAAVEHACIHHEGDSRRFVRSAVVDCAGCPSASPTLSTI
jgi:hypothetical protein